MERSRKVIYSLSSHQLRNYWEQAICKHMKEDWRRPQPSVCRTWKSRDIHNRTRAQQKKKKKKKTEAVQELGRESSDTDRERQRHGGQGRFAWGGWVALPCRCLSRSLTQDFDEAVPALISNPNSTLGLWFTASLFTLTPPRLLFIYHTVGHSRSKSMSFMCHAVHVCALLNSSQLPVFIWKLSACGTIIMQ